MKTPPLGKIVDRALAELSGWRALRFGLAVAFLPAVLPFVLDARKGWRDTAEASFHVADAFLAEARKRKVIP